jgi:hypothetical protein
MLNNMLQLNDKKTETLLITSRHIRQNVDIKSLHVGEAEIGFSDSARNIGVTFDNILSMEAHVTSVSRSIFVNMRNISKIRNLLDTDAVKTLVHATITSRLDYGNALLTGITSAQLERLQRAQNTAARLITRTRMHEHITPVLHELHWLPVRERISYKVGLLVFKCLHDLAPPYLNSLIVRRTSARSLRSNSQLLCVVPRSNLTIGERAFSRAGPKFWNNLPSDIQNCNKIEPFKSMLKTHLFTRAYY